MMVVLARTGSPSTTRPTRNVVPPTSVEMMFLCPSCWPRDTDPMTPPVSTEPTVLIAFAGASAAATAPPLPCMTSSGPARPSAVSLPSRLDR